MYYCQSKLKRIGLYIGHTFRYVLTGIVEVLMSLLCSTSTVDSLVLVCDSATFSHENYQPPKCSTQSVNHVPGSFPSWHVHSQAEGVLSERNILGRRYNCQIRSWSRHSYRAWPCMQELTGQSLSDILQSTPIPGVTKRKHQQPERRKTGRNHELLFQNRLSIRKYSSIRLAEAFETPEKTAERTRPRSRPSSPIHGTLPENSPLTRMLFLMHGVTISR